MISSRSNKGFTLIELLVVLVIIGIIASVVVLATGDFGRSKTLLNQCHHVLGQMRMAQQLAIVNNRVYSLSLAGSNYQFTRFESQPAPGHWTAVTHRLLRKTPELHYGASFSLDKAANKDFSTLFYPDGNATVFRARVLDKQGKTLCTLSTQANGVIDEQH